MNKKVKCYVNPGNQAFNWIAGKNDVDKTALINLMNDMVGGDVFMMCVSGTYRHGKSYAAKMLAANYKNQKKTGKETQEKQEIPGTEGDTEYLDRAAQGKRTRLTICEPVVKYDPEDGKGPDRILLNGQIGKIIKEHRDEMGLSQEALGLLIHTNRKHIGHLESGQCEITVSELIMLAKIFGCNPWDLCPREVISDGTTYPPEIREAVRTLNRWIEQEAG